MQFLKNWMQGMLNVKDILITWSLKSAKAKTSTSVSTRMVVFDKQGLHASS